MTDFEDDKPPEAKAEEQTEQAYEREEVDPALLEEALDDVRMMVRGNGFDPKNITLKHFAGEVLNFEAYSVFKVDPVISEKKMPGREQGEIAGSTSDARHKIATAIERISLDKDVRQLTINILKKRADIGYAAQNMMIRLDRLNKRFVVHEACTACDSSGKILCKNCRGQGKILCTRCNGQRDIVCHFCHGTQFVNTAQGQAQCTHCHGRGRMNCDMCHQTGYIQCPKCKATGRMSCTNCNASGWNSRIFTVNIRAKGNFTYNRETLPEDLLPLLDEYGPDLVLDDHVHARIIEDRQRAEELDRASERSEYIIPYHVKLPWGDIAFSFKGREVAGKLFGYSPMIEMMPPVLEKIMGRGLKALQKAAQGQGNVAKEIAEATRFRAIGETFLAALPNPPQKALAIMCEKYPYGIETDTLKSMIVAANKTTGILTRKPRLVGLGIGALITTILFAAYLVGPIRASLVSALAGIKDPVPDIIVALLGGALISGAIQFSAGKALQDALGGLMKKSGPQQSSGAKLKPKLSEALLWGFPAAIALFGIFLQIAAMTGHAPTWYAHLLG